MVFSFEFIPKTQENCSINANDASKNELIEIYCSLFWFQIV